MKIMKIKVHMLIKAEITYAESHFLVMVGAVPTRASGGRGKDVAALQHERPGLCLHWGGDRMTLSLKVGYQLAIHTMICDKLYMKNNYKNHKENSKRTKWRNLRI